MFPKSNLAETLDKIETLRQHLPTESIDQLRLVSKDIKDAVNKEFHWRRFLHLTPSIIALLQTTPSSILIKFLFANFYNACNAEYPIEKYHENEKNQIDSHSFPGGNITARSLILTRFLAIPHKTTGKSFFNTAYGSDTYADCLALDEQTLEGWANKCVLDIGCGYSMFPAEAKVLYNINVTGIDLYASNNIETRQEVLRIYNKNLLFLAFLKLLGESKLTNNIVPQISNRFMLPKCLGSIGEISKTYLNQTIKQGNVEQGLPYQDDTFHHTVCNWVFMYLGESKAEGVKIEQEKRRIRLDAQQKVLKEMMRVTKVGGEIRICTGQHFGTAIDFCFDHVKNSGSKALELLKVTKPVNAPTLGGLYCYKVVKRSWF